MIISFPEPPNPNDLAYVNNAKLYNQHIYDWACQIKGKLTQLARTLDRPMSQTYQVGAYTTNTTLTGTSSTTDIANFMCSLVASMQQKGIIPSVQINQ